MRAYRAPRAPWVIVAGVLLGPLAAFAQQGIAIDEDLRASAEALPVTMDRQKLFKVGDFRFGDYAIVSSKMGVSHEDDTSVFTNVLTHSDAAERFSFVMKGAGPETATVKAKFSTESGPLKRYEVLPGVSVGAGELSGSIDRLDGEVVVDGGTQAAWRLHLRVKRDVAGVREKAGDSSLSNGVRTVDIVDVASLAVDDAPQGIPARGYQFVEGGKALAALQFYGGGHPTSHKGMVVYLRSDLDAETKLTLAAAMTAILQAKDSASHH
jgi:hypothetical protein